MTIRPARAAALVAALSLISLTACEVNVPTPAQPAPAPVVIQQPAPTTVAPPGSTVVVKPNQ